MPYRELIQVGCDECGKRLEGGDVTDLLFGRTGVVSLFSGHRIATKQAVAQRWYVDAQTVRCPDHWLGHYSVAPVREESTPSPADEGQIVPIGITDCEEG